MGRDFSALPEGSRALNFVLLHSPLVGPSIWRMLAPQLRARGHGVAVPDLTPLMQGEPPFYPALASGAATAVDDDTILIAHSGAGALVPAIAALADLHGVVFVDALLPHPGESWFSGVPADLGARLRGLAKDGRLPPWHAWWPKGAMEAMLPDRTLGAAFIAEQKDLPLAYFEEPAPDVPLAMPAAYLQLSSAYEPDADAAAQAGWPVERLALHHLAPLTHPQVVAAAIEALAARL
jgi:hypothetical protein